MRQSAPFRLPNAWPLYLGMLLAACAYWPGLSGGWLFDDYPNIVDNPGVQPDHASVASLTAAALSSPASEFKRPLSSLTFAANYLAAGLDPFWMKATNLVIHLLNGLLVFSLSRRLIQCARRETDAAQNEIMIAGVIASAWLLLPINLTGVLYVVQRMESMANLFVLLGLIGYVAGRRRMLEPADGAEVATRACQRSFSPASGGFMLCVVSITAPVLVGVLAKETAVMLPLYAALVEWTLFGFRQRQDVPSVPALAERTPRRDRRVAGLFLLVLAVPMIVGLAWLVPGLLKANTWATRDFTLGTRLLSESRIIIDYIVWTLLPTPDALSFYHDNFHISSGLLTPWSTLASIVLLGALIALMISLRRRRPLVSLGIALFLGCQSLTGTILPLELIYEHRNYFASFGLLLAIVPLLAAPSSRPAEATAAGALPMALPRYALLAGLMLCWTALTALTAYAWGNPLRLAEDLAARATTSPRAQYELGRTYIIYSHYDRASPFTRLAYAPLERAAALPGASILPEQALIFMNARMHLPLKDAWWDSMIAKLKTHKPGVQDESSLDALTQCAREKRCDLPQQRMVSAFLAALAHPQPSARLLATYGDYAWNVLEDHALGLRLTEDAVKASPNEPAYQITLIRMLVVQNRAVDAEVALKHLESLNTGGRLDADLVELRSRVAAMSMLTGASSVR